ncbi:hypothetical protein [Chroococcus sp. FPU101]|uniref:hypothetical protein n=1 Tax=Chroococcus sp. FPU101 TaxID=1974212 RepID=UPI001A90C654|nr:hypothetical protein [Chroococcus sp. FPU101]GFE70934.1 hypothetical protein CFPU101_35440 [Chroococcus sp. FPU101]
MPGGCDIVIEYSDGKVFGYDRIKCTYAYISSLPIGSAEIVDLYARKYNEHNFNEVSFERVWNTGDGDYDSMLAALKKFDGNYTYNGGLLDKDLSAILDILIS